jgi:hypothetical protein
VTSWSAAFAAQAASDLDAYNLLVKSPLPMSHRLHYLQMWLEKLCKAYLLRDGAELETTHNIVSKVLPRVIAEHWRRLEFDRSPYLAPIRELCREIDLLHPQVNDEKRRGDNAEYPWPGNSGKIEVPAQWSFPVSNNLETSPGRAMLKAAIILTRRPAIFMG